MRRFILLAGLALAAIPAVPQVAEAHGGRWERERAWRHHEWRREQAWRRHEHREWRREQAWRRHEYRRRHAYGYGYGPPVAYAQPGVTLTIPFR